MSNASSQLKTAARLLGGFLVGVVASGTVAGWLFVVFEWLGVTMDASKGPWEPVVWAAMLASWAAAEFVGQTVAANIAKSTTVIWLVASTHAAILLGAYYFEPDPALLAGAPLGFFIAYLIKDSDLLRMGRRVPTTS